MTPPSEPPQGSAPHVRADSHLTLHYRISLAADGTDVISTFGDGPATLTLGVGQLAESLERCVIGLAEGQEASFELAADQAFGLHNPELRVRVSRAMLDQHGAPEAQYTPGEVLDFAAPNGGRYAGVVQEVDAAGALIDFNHPLAGQAIRFEVQILGVL
jgi:FKBP-type peptidyl-prolyl cis-trans isomerase SlpA